VCPCLIFSHNQSHWLYSTDIGGLNSANQIYDRFKSAGKTLKDGDVAIVDATESHYYQVSSCKIDTTLSLLT